MELVSAVVIMAPPTVQAIAAPLMRQYAPDDYQRVPPHITLLYPFAPYDRLDETLPRLHEACLDIAPFEVTVQGYGAFPGVIYMQPVNPEAVQAVFRQLYATFPEYPPYNGQFGHDLTPHMTVGTFADEAAQQAASLPLYEPLSWQVNRLHVIYGTVQEKLPWLTYDVVRLGG